MVEIDAVLKVAKKILKREDSGCMKVKSLAKEIAKKIGDEQKSSVKLITQYIKESEKFVVDGKTVSYGGKKRSRSPSEKSEKSSKRNRSDGNDGSGGSSEEITASSSLENVASWRKQNKIILKDSKDDEDAVKRTEKLNSSTDFYPFNTFTSPACRDALNPALIRQCTEVNGFKIPTSIQSQSWSILSNKKEKHDMVGIAETGSGKTLAFGLVALSLMAKQDKGYSRLPRMLVLAPTRELAMQSAEVLKEFGAVVGLRSLTVYGGVPKYDQIKELKKGSVDIVVATPGRLKDLINEGNCKLHEVEHLVLDEADRMLDMGFEEDVRFIISNCNAKQRSTAMFSATWPAAIQNIAGEYMTDPVRVYVGFEAIEGSGALVDDSLSANKRIAQKVEVIEDREREARLQKLLNLHHKNKNNKILIFCLYKKETERIEYQLKNRYGWDVCSIHGNKNQHARQQALSEFKSGKCNLLVATDVAARGLDIPNVEMVINYTFPLTIEDYVHRIGRTGRAGKKGTSITFFQPTDKSHAGELQQVMKQAGQAVPDDLMKFGSTIKKKEHNLYGSFGPKSGPMKKSTKITFDF